MRSQIIYSLLFLVNIVHGFTSVNNLSGLNTIKIRKTISSYNKMGTIKMAIENGEYKTPRRYALLYGTTASLCFLNLFQTIKNPQNNLKILENVQNRLFKDATPSICYISTEYGSMADKYNLNKDDLPKGVGSGFVWDDSGHIITNFHVINKVDSAIVTITDKDNNKKEYKAKLTGVDPDTDLAVLKIDLKDNEKLKSIKYNKDVNPVIGQFAFAIGNPFGQDHTLTTGIVSGTNREITAPTGRKINGIIQTDAAINPGNSGGPIIDKDNGHLAAVAVSGMRGSDYQSINYGIKASRVKEFIESNSIVVPKKSLNSKKLKRKEISEILESSTVLIFH